MNLEDFLILCLVKADQLLTMDERIVQRKRYTTERRLGWRIREEKVPIPHHFLSNFVGSVAEWAKLRQP